MTPDRLRLAVVSTSLTGGGAERFTSNLLSGLSPDTFDIALCLVRAELGYPLPPGVRVTDLGKRSVWHYPRTVRRLQSWLAAARPDVILSTIGFTARLTGFALLGLKDSPPWVLRLGSNPARYASKPTGFLDRWLFKKGDCAVGNSLGLGNAIRRRYPYWRHKTFVIGTPTDFSAMDALAMADIPLDFGVDVPVILSVGRLTREKRHDVLLQAFRHVRSRQPARLWICGTGPLEQKLRTYVRANRLQDDVRFFGFQSNPYAVMRRADLFALTSDYEGMPNALIEAQGLGLPAVATRCQFGPEEIVEDGRTGFLVAPDDPQATANAILDLLRDDSLRRAMGKEAAIRTRRAFDKDTLTDRWADLLVETAQSHRSTRNMRNAC